MTIITHSGEEYYPLLFGSKNCDEPTEFITCVKETIVPDLDLFGQPARYKIHISEVKAFKGSYAFAPFVAKSQNHYGED